MASIPEQVNRSKHIVIRSFWKWYNQNNIIQLSENDFREKMELKERYTLDDIIKRYIADMDKLSNTHQQ